MINHISLIGRPNVGKSMLFNALTQTRSALVHPVAGVTRDRKTGRCSPHLSDLPILIHDLGGLTDRMFMTKANALNDPEKAIGKQMLAQAIEAIKRSHVVFFVVDARAGLCDGDITILNWLRKNFSVSKMMLVINKAEFMQSDSSHLISFYELGLGKGTLVSAAHCQGLEHLISTAQTHFIQTPSDEDQRTPDSPADNREDNPHFSSLDADPEACRIALIGRPNVGKSTLTNAFLKNSRMITSSLAGTTREAVASSWEYEGQSCILVDTAGIRKKSTVKEKLEYLGVNKAFAEIEAADLVVLVLDVHQAGERQDLLLVRKSLEWGKSVVIALNKIDECRREELKKCRELLNEELRFAPYLPIVEISAKYHRGCDKLFHTIFTVDSEAKKQYSTAHLNRLLQQFLIENAPPICKKTGKRIRLKYVHQKQRAPIRLSFRGNQLQALPDSYKKFLEKRFRQTLNIGHVPILMHFENQDNPFSKKLEDSPKNAR